MSFKLPPGIRAFIKADPSAPESRLCLLVAEQVGYFLSLNKHDKEIASELFNAGLAALVEKLIERPDLPLRAQKYVIKRAISDAKLTDQNIYVKPATNRKRKQRGQEPYRFTYARDNDANETSVLAPLPQIEQEPQVLDDRTDWQRIIDCFTQIYSACRDENDTRTLQACWDEGRSLQVGRPPTMKHLTRATGLSRNKILESLDYLEGVALKLLKRKKSKRRRKHRSGTCG